MNEIKANQSISGASCCHIVSSVRTRDLLSLYVKAYNSANPNSKISMKDTVDEAVERYLKTLSPKAYEKAKSFLD